MCLGLSSFDCLSSGYGIVLVFDQTRDLLHGILLALPCIEQFTLCGLKLLPCQPCCLGLGPLQQALPSRPWNGRLPCHPIGYSRCRRLDESDGQWCLESKLALEPHD